MLNIETRKHKIINQISKLDESFQIEQIEEFLKRIFADEIESHSEIFKDTKSDFNIDEMIDEQNFTGINREVFDKLINEIDFK